MPKTTPARMISPQPVDLAQGMAGVEVDRQGSKNTAVLGAQAAGRMAYARTGESGIARVARAPEHQRDVVLFRLSTGLRQANVKNLEWSQGDLACKVAWIHPDQAKARAAIHVSLDSVACGVLNRQKGKHETRVFTHRGKPVKWVNTKACCEALQRAGISKGFRWHSLRHTWASWLARSQGRR